MDHPQTFKVCLLGEGCVGKTSIVLQYIEKKFNPSHQATCQAAFFDKKVNIDGKRLKLAIWDTAGQERYHALGPIYYRDSKGAILVYDITDVDSFGRVKNWVKELRKILGDHVVLFIVGNKIDLEKDRKVDNQEALHYAQSVGAEHCLTSAKLNRGVEEVFISISRAMLQKSESEGPARSNRNDGVVIVDDDEMNTGSKGCCG